MMMLVSIVVASAWGNGPPPKSKPGGRWTPLLWLRVNRLPWIRLPDALVSSKSLDRDRALRAEADQVVEHVVVAARELEAQFGTVVADPLDEIADEPPIVDVHLNAIVPGQADDVVLHREVARRAGIDAVVLVRGPYRRQFHHVIDIVPTILEATGIPAPEMINGIRQDPIDGVSMAYTWDKANADTPTKRKTQYFEMLGNRAIYHDGLGRSDDTGHAALGAEHEPRRRT